VKTFRDARDREWTVEVTVATVERVLAEADVDMLDTGDENVFLQMTTQPVRIVHVLYAVLKPQMEAKGLSCEEFADGMKGDAIARASEALTEEWLDFFPDPAERRALRTAMAKTKAFHEKVRAAALKEIESPELETLLETSMEEALTTYRRKLTALSGKPPASSG